MAKERLQKLIAQAGVMSRRKAEEAIAEGRVTVNGVVSKEMGQTADLTEDQVMVDGLPIATKPKYLQKTYLFYKPREVVTTKSDQFGRKTIMDFFPDDTSLNPVGRLDYDSEGLLLLTHDGDLLLKLTHPRYEVEKVYEVDVMPNGVPIPADFAKRLLGQVGGGVALEDGRGQFKVLEEIPSTSKNPVVRGCLKR
jgi:23S rRNA pseudouridine2605 synthase